MTRIYDRDTKHYDFALLSHLVETGQATFFEGPAIYVIKTEESSWPSTATRPGSTPWKSSAVSSTTRPTAISG